ncbi:PxKF domain-containing protein [Dactylosporangium sp. NPDC049140]|uniref:virginiamycin B lyase family protein n=1 Tax=Dactylosporangium sp. NPDC049140 TaxID=3155647 RepID=UPI0033C16E84
MTLVVSLGLLGGTGAALAAPGVTQFPIPTQFADARGIVAGPDGALWFTEGRTNAIGRVTTSGAFTEYPVPDLGSPTVPKLYDITVGSDGALWFTAPHNRFIGRITTAGSITTYQPPNGAGVNGIAAGPDGALWFTGGNQIGRITTTGDITTYPLPATTFGGMITTGPDDALWFTGGDNNGSLIGRITTAGVVSVFRFTTDFVSPNGIVAGSDGALWFTTINGNQVGRITTAGVVTMYPLPRPGSEPWDIDAGRDGALWFVENSGNRIGRITTAGVITEYALSASSGGSMTGTLNIATGPDGAMWFTASSSNHIGRIEVPTAGTAAPTGLAVGNPGAVPVELSWNRVTGAQYYVVYRNGAKINESFPPSFVDRSAHTGANTYFVTAIGPDGESGVSNTVTTSVPTQHHVTGTLSVNGQPLPTTPYSNASVELIDGGGTPRTGTNATGVSVYDVNVTGIFNGSYGVRLQYSNGDPALDTRATGLPTQFLLREVGRPIQYLGDDHVENLDFTTSRLVVTVRDLQGNPVSSAVNVSNVGDSTIANNVAPGTFTVVGGYTNSGSHTDGSGRTSFALFPGATYTVCANACRTLVLTGDTEITLSPATAPATPTVASVTPGDHSATITWLKPADGGSLITGYTVTATPGGLTCSTDSADALSCTITGLTNGVNYTFVVTARNAVGSSPSPPPPGPGGGGTGDGTPIGTVTPGTPPAPVGGVEPVRDPDDGTKVTLHWLAAASDLPIVGYRATATPGGRFCTTDGALTCTITGLTPGQDYAFTVVAINGAGSSDPGDPVPLPADTTPPTVTASYSRPALRVGDTDWFDGPVTVTWNVSDNDGGSGVPAANRPGPAVVTASGSVSSGAVCDAAGNCTTTTVRVGIDADGPSVTINGVTDGTKYQRGTTVTPTCTASDQGAGLAGDCTVTVSGGNANGVGTFTATATATDRVGHTTIRTVTYKIVYRWGGFLQPIDDPARQGGTDLSIFKAGSTVPVKLTLTDAAGNVIQPVSAPVWLTPAKGSSTSLPIDETVYDLPADSGSVFRYTDGQWQYNWKTDKQQAGFYWRIGVRLDDGETYYVNVGLR